MTETNRTTPPFGLASTDGLGAAAAKRDDVALCGSIVLVHLWGAVGYLKPGWFPAMAGTAQLVLAGAIYYNIRSEAKRAQQQSA